MGEGDGDDAGCTSSLLLWAVTSVGLPLATISGFFLLNMTYLWCNIKEYNMNITFLGISVVSRSCYDFCLSDYSLLEVIDFGVAATLENDPLVLI